MWNHFMLKLPKRRAVQISTEVENANQLAWFFSNITFTMCDCCIKYNTRESKAMFQVTRNCKSIPSIHNSFIWHIWSDQFYNSKQRLEIWFCIINAKALTTKCGPLQHCFPLFSIQFWTLPPPPINYNSGILSEPFKRIHWWLHRLLFYVPCQEEKSLNLKVLLIGSNTNVRQWTVQYLPQHYYHYSCWYNMLSINMLTLYVESTNKQCKKHLTLVRRH